MKTWHTRANKVLPKKEKWKKMIIVVFCWLADLDTITDCNIFLTAAEVLFWHEKNYRIFCLHSTAWMIKWTSCSSALSHIQCMFRYILNSAMGFSWVYFGDLVSYTLKDSIETAGVFERIYFDVQRMSFNYVTRVFPVI